MGGSSAQNLHWAELLANSATADDSASAIVRRDSHGDFAANGVAASGLFLVSSEAHKVILRASAEMPQSYAVTLPTASPKNGQVMVSDGAGHLKWTRMVTPEELANENADLRRRIERLEQILERQASQR